MSSIPDIQSRVEEVLGEVADYDRSSAEWHVTRPAVAADDSLAGTIGSLHLINFSLWHCEDRARRTDLSDADVVRSKRAIDALNARRNQTMEKIDEQLLALIPAPEPGTQVAEQFETPGMLIDRLSIMSLRLFHTSRAGMSERLRLLETQRRDLAAVLDLLLRDLFAGRRGLRVYRQFKIATSAPWDCGVWQDAHAWANDALSAPPTRV
jgi:hypothetical protein